MQRQPTDPMASRPKGRGHGKFRPTKPSKASKSTPAVKTQPKPITPADFSVEISGTRTYPTLESILERALEAAERAGDGQLVRYYWSLLMEASLESW
jgi:hypothetical protein